MAQRTAVAICDRCRAEADRIEAEDHFELPQGWVYYMVAVACRGGGMAQVSCETVCGECLTLAERKMFEVAL